MHVLRHKHKALHAHAVQHAGPFQRCDEEVPYIAVGKSRLSVVTGERNEVQRMGVVKAIEPTGHGEILFLEAPQLPTEGNCGPPRYVEFRASGGRPQDRWLSKPVLSRC